MSTATTAPTSGSDGTSVTDLLSQTAVVLQPAENTAAGHHQLGQLAVATQNHGCVIEGTDSTSDTLTIHTQTHAPTRSDTDCSRKTFTNVTFKTPLLQVHGMIQPLKDVEIVDAAGMESELPHTQLQNCSAGVKKMPVTEGILVEESGMIQCTDCPYQTNKRGNFYKHRRKHLGLRLHQCSHCDHRATTSSNLKRHLLIHSKQRQFSCEQCSSSFQQKIHLQRHVKYRHTEKAVECKLCSYRCANAEPDLRLHMLRRHPDPVQKKLKQVPCPHCNFVADSTRDLRQHLKFHKGGPELKVFCEKCSFVTDCASRMKRHMLIHTQERPFACQLCNYCSSQKEHVVRHMEAKHKVTFRKEQSKATVEEARGTEPLVKAAKNKVYPTADSSNVGKVFQCDHCTMSFKKAINLHKHRQMQHLETLTTDHSLKCVVCGFNAASHKQLLAHLRRHNGPVTNRRNAAFRNQLTFYNCMMCNYQDTNREAILTHMSNSHDVKVLMRRDGSLYWVVVDEAGAEQAATLTIPSTTASEEPVVKQPGPHEQAEDTTGTEDGTITQTLPLTEEQIAQLTSGDYVEISGEMYKVELSQAIDDDGALANVVLQQMTEAPVLQDVVQHSPALQTCALQEISEQPPVLQTHVVQESTEQCAIQETIEQSTIS